MQPAGEPGEMRSGCMGQLSVTSFFRLEILGLLRVQSQFPPLVRTDSCGNCGNRGYALPAILGEPGIWPEGGLGTRIVCISIRYACAIMPSTESQEMAARNVFC